MVSLTAAQVKELAKEYGVVPVVQEVYSDTCTPISLLKKIRGQSSRCFLLENVEGGEQWGRYSFLGLNPILRVTCKNHVVTVQRGSLVTTQTSTVPFEILRKLQQQYNSPVLPNLPPFTGGFVGYFGYSMIGYAEPTLQLQSGEWNDFDLMLFDKVIAFDHLRQKIQLIYNVRTDNAEENYTKAVEELNQMALLIAAPPSPSEPNKAKEPVTFTSNLSFEEYAKIVNRAKEYIRDGDIFQAVLSRKFTANYQGSLFNAYRVLRTTNPSPYMVYFCIDGDEIMCSSPETLVRLERGKLTTLPVAGSRPRGKTPEEDLQLEKELLADEKELSEHNMLVDLGRNDLGRISEFGSVKVTEYQMIHRFSKIMHICSQVESTICPGYDGFSAVEAVLPAGTLSGAPKIRACQIIDELESAPRGLYGGAIGYVDFTGNADTCIAIRMAVKKGDVVTIQAGGGIVADSIPENEYAESGNKAQAVIDAVMRAGEVE